MDEYPEDVRQAIEWLMEAEIAHREAKRCYRLTEAEMRLGLKMANSPERLDLELMKAMAPTAREVDRFELEEERRHRWLVYLTGRELRREERGG